MLTTSKIEDFSKGEKITKGELEERIFVVFLVVGYVF